MLRDPCAPAWLAIDLPVINRVVSSDHYLRRAAESIDFERFRTIVAPYYSPDRGRPAEDPVRMVKPGFLQYHARKDWDWMSTFRPKRSRRGRFPARRFLGRFCR